MNGFNKNISLFCTISISTKICGEYNTVLNDLQILIYYLPSCQNITIPKKSSSNSLTKKKTLPRANIQITLPPHSDMSFWLAFRFIASSSPNHHRKVISQEYQTSLLRKYQLYFNRTNANKELLSRK